MQANSNGDQETQDSVLRITFSAARLRALQPVSDGKVMHRIATSPMLAMHARRNPAGAMRTAREQLTERALETPVPADRWMREIYADIERVIGMRLTDTQRRQLCSTAAGRAVAVNKDLEAEIAESHILLRAGRQVVARASLAPRDGQA